MLVKQANACLEFYSREASRLCWVYIQLGVARQFRARDKKETLENLNSVCHPNTKDEALSQLEQIKTK